MIKPCPFREVSKVLTLPEPIKQKITELYTALYGRADENLPAEMWQAGLDEMIAAWEAAWKEGV